MPKTFFLETPRLHLRWLTMDDFDFFFSLQRDPELMRYIRPPETDPEQVRARLISVEQYAAENPGLGSVLAAFKTTGQPAATGIVRHINYQVGEDLELGYLVVREYWGQGLATEFAGGLARYLFEQFGVERITAVVSPENRASQRVLEHCGFVQKGRRFIYDSDNLEYVLDRATHVQKVK